MKKGIALETIVIFILCLISLAIVIIILLKAGLISNLKTIICTSLTTYTSLIRGIVVKLLWVALWTLIIIVGLILLLFSTTCKAFPVGTAACAVVYAVFIGTLFWWIYKLFSTIPLYTCTNPSITIGDFSAPLGSSGASYNFFVKIVAERTVDCWRMYGKGKYSPLTGKAPPNPRTCFVINFNLEREFSLSELFNKVWNYEIKNATVREHLGGVPDIPIMNKTHYCYYVDYWDGKKKGNCYSEKIQKGRLFIKYYDDFFRVKKGDADCFTDWDIMHDRVIWCIEKKSN